MTTETDAQTYLDGLPEDRRALIAAVRDLVRASLPDGYREGVGHGMLTWTIPLSRYPNTYNGQPLAAIALGSMKNYCTLHLTALYQSPAREERLRAAYAEAIAELIAAVPPDTFIAEHEAARAR